MRFTSTLLLYHIMIWDFCILLLMTYYCKICRRVRLLVSFRLFRFESSSTVLASLATSALDQVVQAIGFGSKDRIARCHCRAQWLQTSSQPWIFLQKDKLQASHVTNRSWNRSR